MRTATRFVFEFDEAQTSGKVLSATDADLLRRMVEARDFEVEQLTRTLCGAYRGASLSRQGDGDVVERALAVECPEFSQCNGSKGRACFPAAGGFADLFCASRIRASIPTPAPARLGMGNFVPPGKRCTGDEGHSPGHVFYVSDDDASRRGRCEYVEPATPAPLLEGPRLRDDQRLNELLLDYAASWAANQASFEICQRRRHETLDAIEAHVAHHTATSEPRKETP